MTSSSSSSFGAERRDRAKAWNLSSGEDLEHALRAAERMLQQSEARRRHEQNRTFALVSIVLGTTLSLVASLVVIIQFVTFGTATAKVATALIPALASFLVVASLLRALIKQIKKAGLDYLLDIAMQLSGMIDEALIDVAEREEWSYMRIQATKLRLSAFPLREDRRYHTRKK